MTGLIFLVTLFKIVALHNNMTTLIFVVLIVFVGAKRLASSGANPGYGQTALLTAIHPPLNEKNGELWSAKESYKRAC